MGELPAEDPAVGELPDAPAAGELSADLADGGSGDDGSPADAPVDAVTATAPFADMVPRRPKVRPGVRRLLALQALTVATLVAVSVVVISSLDAGTPPDGGSPTTHPAAASSTTPPPAVPESGTVPAVGSCARREARSWQPADCALPHQGWVVAVVVDPGSDATRQQACAGPAAAAGVVEPRLVDAVPTAGGTLSCVAVGLRP